MTAVRQNILVFDDGDELLDRIARHLASIGASRAQILAQGEASAVELDAETEGAGTTTLDGPLQLLCASGHTDRTSSNLVALIASNQLGPRSGRLRCAFMKTGSAVIFAELASQEAAASPARATASAASAPAYAPSYASDQHAAPVPAPPSPPPPPVTAYAAEGTRSDEVRIGEPRPLEPAKPIDMMGRALPPKPFKRDVEEVVYPEEGDTVTHFVFGRCTVIFSDGERIKLQQEGTSRVREVSLSALKVVFLEGEDGKRQFDLLRRV